jgi:hypothetical protein
MKIFGLTGAGFGLSSQTSPTRFAPLKLKKSPSFI